MENIVKIIVFQIGIQSFGMEINAVEGILKAKDIGNISSDKTIIVNDNVVPVIDLREYFKIPSSNSGENMFVVLSSCKGMLAVYIDKIEVVYDVPYYDLRSVPLVVQNNDNSIFKSIVVLKERLIPLLATEKLFMQAGRKDITSSV